MATGAIEGFASRLYAFSTRRSTFVRDLHSLVADEVLKKVSAGAVLDVGMGSGYLLIIIARKNRSLKVVGIDLSEDMVKMARRNIEKAGLENVELLAEDVVKISLPDESVDLALATMSFHHWADPVKGFNELHRVLKRKGEVWIYELDGHPTLESEAWMKKNYSLITRLIINMQRRHMVKRHASVTVESAEKTLRDPENRFTQYRVEQLEPPVVKMTLIKD